jgi:hypothetical protein
MRGSKRLAGIIHSGVPLLAARQAVQGRYARHCFSRSSGTLWRLSRPTNNPGLAAGPARRAARWRPAVAGYGALSRLMSAMMLMWAVMLFVGGGCSWFPLVRSPAAPRTAVDEPAKVIDLAI